MLGSQLAGCQEELGSQLAGCQEELGSQLAGCQEELGSQLAGWMVCRIACRHCESRELQYSAEVSRAADCQADRLTSWQDGRLAGCEDAKVARNG